MLSLPRTDAAAPTIPPAALPATGEEQGTGRPESAVPDGPRTTPVADEWRLAAMVEERGETGVAQAVPEEAVTDPAVLSVGRIGGLRPRRRPGDGGEASGADVDLVDSLAPATRRTVAAWLLDKQSAATRQTRLQVLAAFVRWLRSMDPAIELLAVTGAHLDAYCDAARAGTLTIGVRNPGRPLSSATVSRKRAVLSSFYTFAWRSGVVRHDRTATVPRPAPARDRDVLSREERRLLREGAARLAAEGRSAEAAAVALLDATGAPVSALAGLTVQDLRAVTAGEPAVVTVHDGRGDLVAFPVPPLARSLLRALAAARTAGEPLLRQPDGHPVDVQWLRKALTDAALAGGVPRERAKLLDPHLMRATTVTELLRDQAS
ncbi:tyrosine-type recombinase/integrase [Nonomuraea sp. GTA35]|uniref:tyrosine-type recombinase/integrase n=1 Tax=Nonomuraea sp. GTA35 TaxID=1676746 RepID=UPI0035C229B9